MRLFILTFLCSLPLLAESTKPFLAVTRQRTIMNPSLVDIDLIEMREADIRLNYDDSEYLIAPYGGVNFVLSKSRLNNIHGVLGIVLAKGDIEFSTDDHRGSEIVAAILGVTNFSFSGIDLRVNFNKLRQKYSMSYTHIRGGSLLFFPVWWRYRAGGYFKQYNTINLSDLSQLEDRLGIDLSAALGVGIFELEFGIEIGRQIFSKTRQSLSPYVNLQAIIPLF